MPSRFVCPAVYLLTDRPFGTLYCGSTNDLPRRIWEHREGYLDGFSREHGCHLLVWYEVHDLMTEAIRRERAIKHWRREWKMELIEKDNPQWRDLYGSLA